MTPGFEAEAAKAETALGITAIDPAAAHCDPNTMYVKINNAVVGDKYTVKVTTGTNTEVWSEKQFEATKTTAKVYFAFGDKQDGHSISDAPLAAGDYTFTVTREQANGTISTLTSTLTLVANGGSFKAKDGVTPETKTIAFTETGFEATAAKANTALGVADADASAQCDPNTMWAKFTLDGTANSRYTMKVTNASNAEVYTEKELKGTFTKAYFTVDKDLVESKPAYHSVAKIAVAEGVYTFTLTAKDGSDVLAKTTLTLGKLTVKNSATDVNPTEVFFNTAAQTTVGDLIPDLAAPSASDGKPFKGWAEEDGSTIAAADVAAMKALTLTGSKTYVAQFGETTPTPVPTEIKVVPANLTAVGDKEPPAYGHAVTYTAAFNTTTKTQIDVTATGLEKTTNTNGVENYWVGVGLTKQDGAQYAWGFGPKPENPEFKNVDRTQTVGDMTYTTLYWSSDDAENVWSEATGYVSVKVGETVTDYTVKFDIKVMIAEPVVSNPVVDVVYPSGATQEVKTAMDAAKTEIAGDDKITFDGDVMQDIAKAAAAEVTNTLEETLKDTDKVSNVPNTNANLTAINAAIDKAKDENNSDPITGVNLVTQVYMDVKVAKAEVTDAGTVSLTFNITPMKQTVLTTAANGQKITVYKAGADSNIATANAVAVTEPTEITTVSEPTEVALTLPAAFVGANAAMWVEHQKGTNTYYYKGTVSGSIDKVLTFTSTHGFSPFKITADAGIVATIGNDGYKTLQAAVDAVKNNEEIVLQEDVDASVKVNVTGETRTFTIDPNGKTFVAANINGITPTMNGTKFVFAYTAPEPDHGSNGGGGGGGVSSNVTVTRPTNGKVSVTPTAPSKGATVTINLTPDTGYAVGTVTVTDKDGKTVELTKVSDTKYTFTMPDGKVTVKATFTKVDAPATGFTDVAADAYYADAVKWAVEKGITNGLTATTFGPNNSCTRGQMVTFLWRAAGSPAATGTNSFSDVASGEYYYNAVLWAVEKGITNGTSATTFSPNATVNRGQTVTFLYRYAESPAATGTSSFTDVAADAFYADAVKWAVAEEITNGTSSTTFSPASNCTRGQIVTFMYRQMAE